MSESLAPFYMLYEAENDKHLDKDKNQDYIYEKTELEVLNLFWLSALHH